MFCVVKHHKHMMFAGFFELQCFLLSFHWRKSMVVIDTIISLYNSMVCTDGILISNHFRNNNNGCLLLAGLRTIAWMLQKVLIVNSFHMWQRQSPTCQQHRTMRFARIHYRSERVKELDATAKTHCNKKLWSLFIRFIYWLWGTDHIECGVLVAAA